MEADNKICIKDREGNKASALFHEENSGERISEFKRKDRDKRMPAVARIGAVEVIDKVAAELNFEERMLAYGKLAERLKEVNKHHEPGKET